MKKSLKLLISFILIVIFTLTLCACDGGKPLNEENCDSGHNLVQSSYTAPTCKTTGEEAKKCTRCGFESKTTLLTISHDYVVKSTTESTCTTRGSQTSECSMCHETKTTTLELKEHDYKLIDSTPSTCVVKGHNDYKCNDCSATKTEELDFADHNYETITTEATCFTHGNTKEICSVCHDTKLINETPLLTHSFETDGYCSKCGIYETLFDIDLLNTSWLYNVSLGTIEGDLNIKSQNNLKIPPEYFINNETKIVLTLYDENEEILQTETILAEIKDNALTIQCGGGTSINFSNKFCLKLPLDTRFTLDTLTKTKSFKLQLSTNGFKTIEQVYNLDTV